jgi:glycosyltransferase involved in cell wall biosynthesis
MNGNSNMASSGTGVSFVVPVYNKAAWLPGVLDMIAAQTGDFEREYIFVDDGSTDESVAIIEARTADWPNVTVYRQTNHGSAHATNQGIRLARLPFIKFVDADDLLARRATETLLAALRGSPACLAYGDVVYYDPSQTPDVEACRPDAARELIAEPLRPALRNSLFNPTQFLVRTDKAREAGGCDERIVHSQEYSLTLRLARLGPFLRVATPVAFLPTEVPGRLGGDMGRQLKRVCLACANFVADHPDLPYPVKQFACRRVAGRAWRFARRERGAGFGSVWFRRYLRSRLPFFGNQASFIERCAGAFD